jgi:hypothetical protein
MDNVDATPVVLFVRMLIRIIDPHIMPFLQETFRQVLWQIAQKPPY